MTFILRTVHGSRLYGLAGPNSDEDIFTVYPTGRNSQKIIGTIDYIDWNLPTFIKNVGEGIPQALEALWSEQAFIADEYKPWFSKMYPNFISMVDNYSSTMHSSVLQGTAKGNQRAMRMAYNLGEAYEYGKFNPTISERVAKLIVNASHIMLDTKDWIEY